MNARILILAGAVGFVVAGVEYFKTKDKFLAFVSLVSVVVAAIAAALDQ